jgi:hypothetical protein
MERSVGMWALVTAESWTSSEYDHAMNCGLRVRGVARLVD